MYALNQIKHVHLEISTLCNASCAWCPRNFWGYPYNGGYPELNFTLANAEHIFTPDFLKQLDGININGNFGDCVMNPDTPLIVDYFLTHNPELKIEINTNGGARYKDFWISLARPGVRILFALDGLEDTHHLYRQNTAWNTVIKNAQSFIQAGGQAVWKMIRFDHNQHQVEQCRQLSRSLGFADFITINSDRTIAPVFNKQGQLQHTLGNYIGEQEFAVLFHSKKTDTVLLEDIVVDKKESMINCQVKRSKSVYISANGDVSPCCWTGLYPNTYGKGQYHEAANEQLKPIIKNNNALKYSLKECINWFNEIEKTWAISTFEQGRLVICNDVCGTTN
jgi:MoaA/NifB/PqqE/SkfB family radical SAM enzyme